CADMQRSRSSCGSCLWSDSAILKAFLHRTGKCAGGSMARAAHTKASHLHLVIKSFSRRFYPKRLTRMYTHFTFTLMAHCTSGAIRGSVSCSRTLLQGIELATF